MFFGKDENIRCIESIPRFEVTDINGNPQTVCYAAKVTTNSFIVPYRTYVDSYVLGLDDNNYYSLDQEYIEELQSLTLLPSELPSYNLKGGDFIYFWIILGAIPVLFLWNKLDAIFKKIFFKK